MRPGERTKAEGLPLVSADGRLVRAIPDGAALLRERPDHRTQWAHPAAFSSDDANHRPEVCGAK